MKWMSLEPVIQSEESQRKTSFVYYHEYNFIYMESRKTVLMNLFAGQTYRTDFGHSRGRRGWDELRE